MNPTASPAARKRTTASAAPGRGLSPSHTTPSRSRTTAGARPLVVVIRLGRRLAQGVPIGLLVGPHDGGHLEVSPGAGPVAGAQQAQAEPEVGIVVHRVELEHLLELRPGLVDPL